MIRQKTWLLWETHFPFVMVQSKMNLQSFKTSPREITFVTLQKNSMSYFLSVLSVMSWLKCIIHQNFGKLDLWMQISFIILFMIDLYKDVCFFKRLLLRNY